MQRPYLNDFLEKDGDGYVDYTEYSEKLNEYIDHLESLPLKTEEEVKHELVKILDEFYMMILSPHKFTEGQMNIHNIADKILSLLQPKGIEFPTEEIKNIAAETWLKLCWEHYNEPDKIKKYCIEDYKKGFDECIEKIKELNNIS